MRFRFIKQHAHQYKVGRMCRVLQVSRAGYYAWRRRGPTVRQDANGQLLELLRQLFLKYRKRYGYRRIHAVAREEIPCGIHRVARLMRQDGLRVQRRRSYRVTTQSKHKLPVAPNILGQDFRAAAPNQIWLSDITYVPTRQGWLYLAVVLDLYARRVVGWGMTSHLGDILTRSALQMALKRRQPGPALLHHSDRGIQYASRSYRNLLTVQGVTISMSRKGNAQDNAPMESFFATLKKELIHRLDYQTRNEARTSIFEYIEGFYNPVRIHSALRYHTPIDYEALFISP